MHASYNDLIDRQKNYIVTVKQENIDLIEEKTKLNDNNAYLKNRLEKTNAELRKANNVVDDLKKENYILINKMKKNKEGDKTD